MTLTIPDSTCCMWSFNSKEMLVSQEDICLPAAVKRRRCDAVVHSGWMCSEEMRKTSTEDTSFTKRGQIRVRETSLRHSSTWREPPHHNVNHLSPQCRLKANKALEAGVSAAVWTEVGLHFLLDSHKWGGTLPQWSELNFQDWLSYDCVWPH